VTDAEQIAGLLTLQRVVGAYEVNTVLDRAPGDVACVKAISTPDASEICFASGEGYDVWNWRNGKRQLVKTGLDVGAAANVVVVEYMTAKVRRAKQNDPRLRAYSDKALLTHLLKGYQDMQQRGGTA
jgi:hypothetical protein